MNETPLQAYLLLAALLFCIGLAGVLTRRNAILVLLGIELMLNAANLNFIAFWRYGPNPQALSGFVIVLFSIAVAAAEAAVGLALVISVYRHYQTADLDALTPPQTGGAEQSRAEPPRSGTSTSGAGGET